MSNLRSIVPLLALVLAARGTMNLPSASKIVRVVLVSSLGCIPKNA